MTIDDVVFSDERIFLDCFLIGYNTIYDVNAQSIR